MEEFKTIEGYDNYEVSNKGNVRNKKTNKFIKTFITIHGYFKICLCKNRIKKTFTVHKLVAIAFILNPENKENIDHIDNNRLNNNAVNLRWCSNQENCRNRLISCKNKTGFKGVMFYERTKKWKAQITIDGRNIHLGYFDSLEAAKEVRQLKANQVFGIFTNACEKIA
jgi:hypothetical protein